MKKLNLRLDDLAIESFDTTAAPGDKGTVFGEQDCTCYTCTCPGCPTCDYTCDDVSCGGENTCWGQTCEGTCRVDTCGFSQYDTCPRICPLQVQ